MAYDESVKSLGNGFVTNWTPRKSTAGSIMGFLNTVLSASAAKEKEKVTRYKEQVDLYNSLRKAGYSAEEATAKINKTNSGRSFLGKILGKQQEQFTVPTGEDPFLLENQKNQANLDLTKAKTGYYKQGGASRTVIDSMTPNQLQQRLKFLKDSVEMLEEDDPEYAASKNEMIQINRKLRGMSVKATNEPSGEDADIEINGNGNSYLSQDELAKQNGIIGTFTSSSGRQYRRYKDGRVEWL